MKLQDYLVAGRDTVAASVREALSEHGREAAPFGDQSDRLYALLTDYAVSGKMLRGILALLGFELFDGGSETLQARRERLTRLAAALELFQAGLLVHDDIMDRDELRRGRPTMHKIFEREEAEAGAPDPAHLGEAIGICAGDLYYMLAWELVSEFGPEMSRLFSQELRDVCLAQIKDVKLGNHPLFPALDEIIEVYLYKTARYTISLPLCAGAIAAGRQDALPILMELGINLGILFQIQDDYLGLFGNEKELGKPIGSDIREAKKTPYMILLNSRMTEAERSRFNAIFGNRSIGAQDVEFIKNLVTSYGIDSEIRALAEAYAMKAKASIIKLEALGGFLNQKKYTILNEFVEYSLSRSY
jgi:geranylgeranyl diphosphate synthase type I